MVKRILTALFLAPPFLYVLWYGEIYIACLCSLIAGVGAYELVAMANKEKSYCRQWLAIPWAALIPLCAFKWGFANIGYTLIIPFFLLIVPAIIRGDFKKEADSVAYTLLAVIYCGFMVSFMVLLRTEVPLGQYLILMLILMIWMQDTGAYFFGTAFGKHKLTKLSPKKSWEGSVAGLTASVVTGWAFISYTPLSFSIDKGFIIVGLILVALAGQLGDLFESLLKRDCGVKDSGSLIPGHGGVLDRFDSLIMAAPVLYFFCQVIALPKG
jgi:phosphatidate cytidylyltransferase